MKTTLRPQPRTFQRIATIAVAGFAGLALAACNATTSASGDRDAVSGGSGGQDGSSATGADTAAAKPSLTVNVKRGAHDVGVDTVLQVAADQGRLSHVSVRSAAGRVPGLVAADGLSWTADDRLEPGTDYTVRAVADHDGAIARSRTRFSTVALSLPQQAYPTLLVAPDSTVGIGMPVQAHFDVPITDKASFEKNMHVTSTPAQKGSWHWISDYDARWRPATYWKPGTTVDVDLDVNGVPAGNGIYGQMDRREQFTIGDAHIYRVNAVTHQMKVFNNGKLIRTIPITTGGPGYTTRSGVKVISELDPSVDMNSETVGITGSDGYDLKGVQWAMRLTTSGEYIHAAPWSVGSQGYANVSHGCTGMSTDNAAWLFAHSQVGDVVVTTGTGRPMTLDNGLGDWNESFSQYRQGSALA